MIPSYVANLGTSEKAAHAALHEKLDGVITCLKDVSSTIHELTAAIQLLQSIRKPGVVTRICYITAIPYFGTESSNICHTPDGKAYKYTIIEQWLNQI